MAVEDAAAVVEVAVTSQDFYSKLIQPNRSQHAQTSSNNLVGNNFALKNLGVGLSYRSAFRADLFLNRHQVDFLEIIAEHYLDLTPEREVELEMLANHFILIPHAIGLSLGSAQGVNLDYCDKLAVLIERLNPPWWTEHIAFTHAGGIHIGHLSPLPYTHEAIEAVCRNIRQVKQQISAPLYLENITAMFTLPGAQMSEAAFIREILIQSGCGMLLDVTNLYTNAVNLGYEPEEFLDTLPFEALAGRLQLHFVGGHWHRNRLIDSHSAATPDEVWQLVQSVLKRTSVQGMVLEWDENLPVFDDLLHELNQARGLGQVSQFARPETKREKFLWR